MKSFETSGMFVQEMILVAFFLLILVEIRLLCVQHSRKQKVEVMAVNFLLLSVTYGILTDLLSDYLANPFFSHFCRYRLSDLSYPARR